MSCTVLLAWGGGGGGGGECPPKLTLMHGSQVRGLTYNECSLINVANALAYSKMVWVRGATIMTHAKTSFISL